MYLKDQFLYFRHHVPVIFYLLFHVHNLFIVINSSINVIVYYCVGKEFRKEAKSLWKHVKEKLCCRSNTWIYITSIYDNTLWNFVPCFEQYAYVLSWELNHCSWWKMERKMFQLIQIFLYFIESFSWQGIIID